MFKCAICGSDMQRVCYNCSDPMQIAKTRATEALETAKMNSELYGKITAPVEQPKGRKK